MQQNKNDALTGCIIAGIGLCAFLYAIFGAPQWSTIQMISGIGGGFAFLFGIWFAGPDEGLDESFDD